MFNIAKRNILLFFRSKSTVFFSILGVLILFALYILFLGETNAKSFENLTQPRFFVDSFLTSGIMAVASLSTTIGALEFMVTDKESRRIKDIYAAPVKRTSILFGYLLGAIIVGFIMSIFALIVSQVYVVIGGGKFFSLSTILKTILISLLSVISSSTWAFFIVSFIKNSGAFAALSTIIGTFSGFLSGAYLPLGMFSKFIKVVVFLFPVSHSASLFRKVLLYDAAKISFSGIPDAEVLQIKEFLGLTFKVFNTEITALMSVIFLILTTIIFFALAYLVNFYSAIRKKNKTKKGS